MADGDEGRMAEWFRWQGRIEERMEKKADRLELAELHKRTAEMDSEVEQRGRDLLDANIDGVRREVRGIEEKVQRIDESVKANGRGVEGLHRDISSLSESNDEQRKMLAEIRENVSVQARKKINWGEWIRWGLIIVALLGAALTQDFKALLTFLK